MWMRRESEEQIIYQHNLNCNQSLLVTNHKRSHLSKIYKVSKVKKKS